MVDRSLPLASSVDLGQERGVHSGRRGVHGRELENGGGGDLPVLGPSPGVAFFGIQVAVEVEDFDIAIPNGMPFMRGYDVHRGSVDALTTVGSEDRFLEPGDIVSPWHGAST